MEPERERTRTPKHLPKPTASKLPDDTQPEEFRLTPEGKMDFEITSKNYAQEISVVLGFGFFVVGLLGFVIPYFLNAHLSYAHNLIHIITGGIALWFAFHGNVAARQFGIIFGSLYFALGLLGFALGTSGVASVANTNFDAFLWRPWPDVLELGTSDHVIHLIAGATFALGASITFRVRVPKEKT